MSRAHAATSSSRSFWLSSVPLQGKLATRARARERNTGREGGRETGWEGGRVEGERVGENFHFSYSRQHALFEFRAKGFVVGIGFRVWAEDLMCVFRV